MCIGVRNKRKLEGCIDDERQFKTAKRPHALSDCSERFFRDNFVIFRHRSKGIAFEISEFFYLCLYANFRDGHMTSFWHLSGAYICQMPGHGLSRLVKGTPSEYRLSIGTIDLE